MAGELTLPLDMLITVNLDYQPKLLSLDSMNRLLIIGSSVSASTEDRNVYTTLSAVQADFGVEAPEYLIAKSYFLQIPKPKDLMIATVDTELTNQQAIESVAETTMAYYGFCFTEQPLAAELQGLSEWAQLNHRMFITSFDTVAEAYNAALPLKDLGLYHHSIQFHEDYYGMVGGVSGVGLNQKFEQTDGIKTLQFKSITGLTSSDITQSEALQLKGVYVNYYSDYGNPDNSLAMFANGYAGDGMFFDFVMGFDWLRNLVQTYVLNGMRLRDLTPQTDEGMMFVVNDMIQAFEQAVKVRLFAGGQWNGSGLGDIETYDYLENGYYIYYESIASQSQVVRQTRQAPPISAIAKGAGALHGVDISITPEA